jgi:hypothetical protein
MTRLSGLAAIALTFLLAAPALPFAQSEEPEEPEQQEPAAPPPQPQETPAAPAPAAPPPHQQEPPAAPIAPTLGEFAMSVAAGLKLPAPLTGFTPESAAWGLLQKGIRLRAELTSPLTESDAVSILNGLGYKIRTETPSRVMSAERAGLLLETFINPAK